MLLVLLILHPKDSWSEQHPSNRMLIIIPQNLCAYWHRNNDEKKTESWARPRIFHGYRSKQLWGIRTLYFSCLSRIIELSPTGPRWRSVNSAIAAYSLQFCFADLACSNSKTWDPALKNSLLVSLGTKVQSEILSVYIEIRCRIKIKVCEFIRMALDNQFYKSHVCFQAMMNTKSKYRYV